MNTTIKIPVLPLRNGVLFPGQTLPIVIESKKASAAVEAATNEGMQIFAVTQRSDDVPANRENLHAIGVIAKIGLVKRGLDRLHLVLQGEKRATGIKYDEVDGYLSATVTPIQEMAPLDADDPNFAALFLETRDRARELGELKGVPEEALNQIMENLKSPGPLADQIAGVLEIEIGEKQLLLETLDVEERLRKVLVHLERQIGLHKAQERIKTQVQEELGERQKEMYLREQLKTIQKELGENKEFGDEYAELARRLAKLNLPDETRTEVDKELKKLRRAGEQSMDAQVSRNYLEWIADLPWDKRSEDLYDLKRAADVLAADHYGLYDVKDRILEFLAVRKLITEQTAGDAKKESKKATNRGPIMLFVGPPGVGKTSIAKSIARALGREYVRVALGGTRDEADIRGHRRTYIGAMPGRIIQGLKRAGTSNPVFLLDEIDKLGVSFQGDPSSALMEVLDPAQNDSFTDHYLNVPFDLSEVLFIATANFLEAIPGPLRDRMEMIEFAGYTEHEKVKIAQNFLIPRQFEENGLRDRPVLLSAKTIGAIVAKYTHESGVRQLEREIGKLARKLARRFAEKGRRKVTVTEKNLTRFLGRPRIRREQIADDDLVGVATGMYYTPAGGDIMFVEASLRSLPSGSSGEPGDASKLGNVSLILTGHLGDVMKESARAALTYATKHAFRFGIPPRHLGAVEAHIHVPAGAIPKDGPSAGVTIATALTSALSGRPVRRDLAMTGEITLLGRVLPIGGLKEKVLGAHRAGIKQIIIPKENKPDLEDIPKEIKQALTFHFVDTLDEVFALSLLESTEISHVPPANILLATDGYPLESA